VYATTTDNDGRFEIKQIEAGRYNFYASHIGYLEQQYQSKGADDDDGAVLSLTANQEVTDVMFRLIRAGVITGKVVDDTGEPMMGVSVSVLHKPSEEEREERGPHGKKMEMSMVSAGQTDDRGEFRIFNLKPGEYYVKAAETGSPWGFGGAPYSDNYLRVLGELGSEFAPVYYPGVLQLDQAQAVTLGAGEEAHADIAMRRMKTTEVAGRVIGPDGGPGVRSFVSLSLAGVEDWGGELGGMTDSSGEFSVKGVPPGSYYIRAGTQEKGKYYNTRQKIEVGEAKIDSLVLTLGSGATIHGRIRSASGAPLPSGRTMVHLESIGEEGGTGFGFTEVNQDGSFELSGVSDGSYAVMTSPIGEGWFIQSAHLGNEDALVDGLQVEGGAAKGSLEIVASNNGAQIEGTVTDSDKHQPLAGVQIKAQVDPSTDYTYMRSRAATTDQNGHYVLKDVPPHKYKVTAKMPSAGAGVPAIKSDAVAVSVGGHEHRTLDFTLTMPKSE
jgi:protocatechuate 3,4-dioxygenase beta subunit